MQIQQLVDVPERRRSSSIPPSNQTPSRYSPHVHLLPVDFVVVKVEQVDGAGHAFVAVFVALHHAAVVQQTLEQPRHGRDERRARLAPRGILRLDAFQKAEVTEKIAQISLNLNYGT